MLLFSKSFSVSIENHSCYLIKENKIYSFLLLKDHYANMHVQKFKNVCTWLTCAYLWFRLGFRGLQQGFLFRFWERFLLSFGVDRPLLGSRFRPTVLLGFGSVFVGAFRLVGWRRPKQGTEVRILQATKNTSPPFRCGPGAFKYVAVDQTMTARKIYLWWPWPLELRLLFSEELFSEELFSDDRASCLEWCGLGGLNKSIEY